MITNFEEITSELNEKELSLIPILIKGFQAHENKPIKAPEIVSKMNNFMFGWGFKMTEPRLRKMVNYIRSNSLLPLIATSEGYYISNDKEVIKNQIKSLAERANSIERCAKGLEKFI